MTIRCGACEMRLRRLVLDHPTIERGDNLMERRNPLVSRCLLGTAGAVLSLALVVEPARAQVTQDTAAGSVQLADNDRDNGFEWGLLGLLGLAGLLGRKRAEPTTTYRDTADARAR